MEDISQEIKNYNIASAFAVAVGLLALFSVLFISFSFTALIVVGIAALVVLLSRRQVAELKALEVPTVDKTAKL